MKLIKCLCVCLCLMLCVCCRTESPTSQINTIDSPTVIDVSHYNDFDWELLPSSVEGVYIKATTGTTGKDWKYKYNLSQAKKRNLKIGSYHYLTSYSSIETQFENFKSKAKKKDQDLIPMIDVESCLERWTKKQTQDSIQKFINLCKQYYGKAPMIYGTMRSYNTYCAPRFNNYHLMIGKYSNSEPVINGKGTYTLWQYTESYSIGQSKIDGSKFNTKYSLKNILL